MLLRALTRRKKPMAKRAEALSEEVLESLRDRQQSVIEAMRKFVDRLDDAMPNLVDPAVRKKVVDAIGAYYEQLATTTNEVVGRMLRSAIGTAQESTTKRQLLVAPPKRQLLDRAAANRPLKGSGRGRDLGPSALQNAGGRSAF